MDFVNDGYYYIWWWQYQQSSNDDVFISKYNSLCNSFFLIYIHDKRSLLGWLCHIILLCFSGTKNISSHHSNAWHGLFHQLWKASRDKLNLRAVFQSGLFHFSMNSLRIYACRINYGNGVNSISMESEMMRENKQTNKNILCWFQNETSIPY